jgi:hypothetical protein
VSVYVDPDWIQQNKATVTVSEEPKTARVTYRGEDGKKFRVNVVQRPNPIGFHARLPGDKRK